MAKKNNAKNASDGSKAGNIQSFSIVAPRATNVQLVGDFTSWLEKPINMRKDKQGTWKAKCGLSPGAHYYRFLVDGQWQDDPESKLHAQNPFGGQDAVRHVA